MIDLGVKIEFPKKTREEPGAIKRMLGRTPLKVAHAVAAAVKKRVALKGKTVQPFKGYADGNFRAVSPGYPIIAPGHMGEHSDAIIYESSKVMHQNVKPGTFNVTGGMWKGLTVMAKAGNYAIIKFRGRSQGQLSSWWGAGRFSSANDNLWHRRKKKDGTRAKVKARSLKVNNALKAASIRNKKAHGINVLDLLKQEYQDIALGVTAAIRRACDYELISGAGGAVRVVRRPITQAIIKGLKQ